MTQTPSKSARERAERIVREKGGLCLVPKEDSQHRMTCHEWTFCDCHVETIIEKAIEKAEKRGVIRGLRMAAKEALHQWKTHSLPSKAGAAGDMHDWCEREADRLEKELTESGEGSE